MKQSLVKSITDSKDRGESDARLDSDEQPVYDKCGTWEKYQTMGFSLVWPDENGKEFRRGIGYDELVIKPKLFWDPKGESVIMFRYENDEGKTDISIRGEGEDFKKVHRHLMLGKRFTVTVNGTDVKAIVEDRVREE